MDDSSQRCDGQSDLGEDVKPSTASIWMPKFFTVPTQAVVTTVENKPSVDTPPTSNETEPNASGEALENLDEVQIVRPSRIRTRVPDLSRVIPSGHGVRYSANEKHESVAYSKEYASDEIEWESASSYEPEAHVEKPEETSQSESPCHLPKVSGSCGAKLLRFHYDAVKGQCIHFWYSGCGGNQNRFQSLNECQKHCIDPRRCARFMHPGFHCRRRAPRMLFYFDCWLGQCKSFKHNGCGGNTNQFHSMDDCVAACSRGHKLRTTSTSTSQSTKQQVQPANTAQTTTANPNNTISTPEVSKKGSAP
ncbi:unnamed protein product [Notodromas monacha]|uniref:BPTI/Kunitz inhibitor domain-containing protein n=1 Tax=Notodromas monacha TaxID=399045 RepID=A0A7R9BCV1_9CRUS|nr:unnamed protein product [Notodromas monacha]CAG0912323.1 unnamed protein product [Notodromas monacha]